MRSRTRWLVLPAFLVIFLALCRPAAAVFPPPVKDGAKMFTKEGLEKADKMIKEIYRKFKKDVVVETYAEVPADLAKKLEDKGEKAFFAEWASQRAKELGVNGIYLLVSKKPRYLYIEIDGATRKKAFTSADRKTMEKKLFAAFKEMKFDQGLSDALESVEASLKKNLK
jgi:uncharacterized membrane protein YgcG